MHRIAAPIFAALACAALFAPLPAAAGWEYISQGTRAQQGWYRMAITRDAGTIVLDLQCNEAGLKVTATPREPIFMPDPVEVRTAFDGGPAETALWEGGLLSAELREEAAGSAALLAFAAGLARRSTLHIDLAGEAAATIALKGSAGPVRKVLAACGH
jgi:hypothetical protein